MQYLDPKADLTFKKVFGQHKDLTMSLINALLPLPEGGEVADIEYLTPELMPETPFGRNSIVDVRCKDSQGRQFLVEMQTVWTEAFMTRVLFNSSKAYVRQIGSGSSYTLLQPVYSLSLVNATFLPDLPDEFIHNYNIVHEYHSEKVIDGLHLTFVELPKFKPQTIAERKMAVLWLRFLTEITPKTDEIPKELLDNELTNKALSEVRKSSFSEKQLLAYDKFWDSVSVENTLVVAAKAEGEALGRAVGEAQGMAKGMAKGIAKGIAEGRAAGHAEGRAVGRAEGRAEGLEEGKAQANIATAKKLLANGIPAPMVAECTGLALTEVEKLLHK